MTQMWQNDRETNCDRWLQASRNTPVALVNWSGYKWDNIDQFQHVCFIVVVVQMKDFQDIDHRQNYSKFIWFEGAVPCHWSPRPGILLVIKLLLPQTFARCERDAGTRAPCANDNLNIETHGSRSESPTAHHQDPEHPSPHGQDQGQHSCWNISLWFLTSCRPHHCGPVES